MIPNGWVPLGPSTMFNGQLGYESTGRGPVSGRCTALALHPDHPDTHIYAGTAMGGVWGSTDAGLNWAPLTDNQPSLAVGAMAFSTSAPRKLWVATGEGNSGGEIFFGSGVLEMDDASGNWTLHSDPLLSNQRASAMAVETLAAGDHILIGSTKGLIESLDSGATWNPVTVVTGSPGAFVSGLVLDTRTDPNQTRLYVAIQGDGIYRKIGTAAFTRLTSGGPGALPNVPDITRITVAMCPNTDPAKRLNLYAVYAKKDETIIAILKSSDGGDNWTTLPLPRLSPKQSNYNIALAVHPNDPNTVIFGESRLWRTTDAGAHWELISEPHGDTQGIHADQHVAVYHPTNPTNVWAGNDGGVWLSTNSGTDWHHRNRGLQTMQYYSVAQHPDYSSLLLAGAQDNGTQRFEGHPAWRMVSFGDGFFCAIDQQQPLYWYASYVFQSSRTADLEAIYRSDRGGNEDSWKLKVDGIGKNDTPDGLLFYVPFIIDPSQTNVLYLGTTKLYRTDNRGDQWAPIKKTDGTDFSTGNSRVNTITAIAVSPSDSNTVYVGTNDGQLFHLQRGGDGKYTVNARPGLPGAYVGDIAVPAGTPSQKVYVAIGSEHFSSQPDALLGAGRIFRSDNNGAAWVPLGGPTLNFSIGAVNIDHRSNPVNAIALDPANPQTVYIGCNIGLFKSADEGGSWTLYNENLPNVAVADLQFHVKSRLLRAATIGRSVWERAVDAAPGGTGVDIFIRDNLVDLGRGATPNQVVDPFVSGNNVQWSTGIDAKLDTPFLGIGGFTTPTSTVDYTPGGEIDYIGFQQLDSNDARRSVTSKLYVQAINRGPVIAQNVKLRSFWAKKGNGSFPDLPADFWAKFPDSDPDTSVWKPVGPAQTIATLRPGEPAVVTSDWPVPGDAGDTIGLLSVITVAEDPVNENGLAVQTVATQNKHVALREISVGARTVEIVVVVLLLVGVATVGVIAATQ